MIIPHGKLICNRRRGAITGKMMSKMAEGEFADKIREVYHIPKDKNSQMEYIIIEQIIENCHSGTLRDFITAVKADDIFLASKTITKKPSLIDTRFYNGLTLLYIAAIFDAPNVAVYLISNKANKNVCTTDGQELQSWVTTFGSNEIINVFKGKYDTRVQKSAIRSDLQKKLIKDFSKFLNLYEENIQKNITMYEKGCEVESIREGFNADISYNGYPFLFYVVVFDHIKLAEFLLDVGADTHAKNCDGMRVFDWVRFNGSPEMYALFTKPGPKRTIRWNEGFTKISEVIENLKLTKAPESIKRSEDAKKFFGIETFGSVAEYDSPNSPIEPGSPVNVYTEAIKNKLIQKAKHGGDMDLMTIIEIMPNGNVEEFMEIMFNERFEPDRLYDGYNLLHLAMIYNNVEVSQFLIENGMGDMSGPGIIPAKNWAEMYGSEKIRKLFS